jgi:hypothetical protein
VVDGKRVVIVEDSVVRGTTTRSKMRALRSAGAKEIHLRVSCPPIRHPCFYGIDFPTSEELIAHNRTVEQIREFLEVDSVAYLVLEGLLACMKRRRDDYCTACWSRPLPRCRSTSAAEQIRVFERDQLKMLLNRTDALPPKDAKRNMSNEFRTEKDSMGEMKVPADVYYGASTARAVENFPHLRPPLQPPVHRGDGPDQVGGGGDQREARACSTPSANSSSSRRRRR